ncbi:PH-like domain-containing protein [Isoptericola aurantiacus]|uniref:PH-like domain-containing protein n=1 Tax=Isoptericola aurantiacus TaxID=3377839 RepID=UPI00383AB505
MNLPVPVAVGIWVALGLVLLLLVLTGRRRLATRTRRVVPAPPAPPEAEGALGATLLGPVEATYVSSTLSGDWLARVGAHGLGDRSAAEVTVWSGGVVVDRAGGTPLLVPAAALRDVGTAPGMAGKYVGRDGLVVLTWEVPTDGATDAVVLDTGLRTRYRADTPRLLETARSLLTPSAPPHPSTPTTKDTK